MKIACPAGDTVAEVVFASWGDWSAECGAVKLPKSVKGKDQCSGAGCNGGAQCDCE